MWERRLALVRRACAKGKLLDVGTGDGHFLRVCRAAGYEAAGTEVSDAGAAYARKNGFDVHLGQLTDIDLPPKGFDIITIWHVLEHVPEPSAVLRKAISLLRPRGILVLAVPNEENFFVRRRLGLSTSTSPFDPLQFGGEIHLTYFRPPTLQSALRSAGFALEEFGVDDIYAVRSLSMKWKFAVQRLLARTCNWHFAVAMYAICRRPVDSVRSTGGV
jgi:2-polyprenyl-3-methyl-5-hydroxy-6-metoxy-1,4-benzoquinol methylase